MYIICFFLLLYYVNGVSYQAFAGDRITERKKLNFFDVFPEDHSYSIKCIQKTSDGGEVFTGKIRPNGPGDSDIFLLKISNDGIVQWMNLFGDEGYEEAFFVNQTEDDGFIVVGSTTGYDAIMEDVFIVKTDCMGVLEWYGRYGGNNPEWGVHAKGTSDGGYLINGKTLYLTDPRICDPGIFKTYLIKINYLGDLEWDMILDDRSKLKNIA